MSVQTMALTNTVNLVARAGFGAGTGAGGAAGSGFGQMGLGRTGGGGGAQRQNGGRPQQPLTPIQQAGISREDGCVLWSGRDRACGRVGCPLDHPAGTASVAYQKYVRTYNTAPPQPQPQQPPRARRN